MHFGMHDEKLDLLDDIHIPIRHPIDVANGWACRPKPLSAVNDMIESFGRMFDLIGRINVTLHKIEDIPKTVGGPREHLKNPDPQRIEMFKDAVTKYVLGPNQAFYDEFYP